MRSREENRDETKRRREQMIAADNAMGRVTEAVKRVRL
jgi:hypothetical protein